MDMKNFMAQMERQFPWPQMENTVTINPITNVAEKHEFVLRLKELFDVYSEFDPLRCVEICDWVLKQLNMRDPDCPTLAHVPIKENAELFVKYLQRAQIKVKDGLTAKHALMALVLLKEAPVEDIQRQALAICKALNTISVQNLEEERKYVEAYKYLWNKGDKFHALFADNGLL